ncbi:MAG: hypothetical protein KDI68_12550 [Gammaproteobacteria bacterium]|nr:hypothetical protein [Gammaproteobacteria bacterium]
MLTKAGRRVNPLPADGPRSAGLRITAPTPCSADADGATESGVNLTEQLLDF